MYQLYVKNNKGQKLELSYQSKIYAVCSVEGLNPPNATINFATVSGADGGIFNSSKVEMRNLVITVKILGNVEENRIYLYNFFKVKQWVDIYYKNGLRDVHIEGYTESLECDLFTKSQEAQISILCNQPYFEDAYSIIQDISQIINCFEFPFSIEEKGMEFSIYNEHLSAIVKNIGDVETGFMMRINATDMVEGLKIYNGETREYFAINMTMQSGDLVEIDTRTGQKSITLIRNAISENIINFVEKNSTWLTIKQGINTFTYTCTEGTEHITIDLVTRNKYSGV